MNVSSLVSVSKYTNANFLGTRYIGREIRMTLESMLDKNEKVTIDFNSIDFTQSFIDELIGVLIITRGPKIIEKIIFKNCPEDSKDIIKFVVSDRLNDYEKDSSVLSAQH